MYADVRNTLTRGNIKTVGELLLCDEDAVNRTDTLAQIARHAG